MSKFKPSATIRPKRSATGKPSVADGKAPSTGVSQPLDGQPSEALSAAVDEPEQNAFQKIGFVTTLLFVYLRFSFVHEFIAAKTHINTHLVIGLGAASYLFCILSGQFGRALRDKSTWMWLGFTACMCVATATSFWRGGSFRLLLDFLDTVIPIVIVLPAVTVTRSQVIKMVGAIAIACVTTVSLGIFSDDFKSGRMGMDAQGSDIQDPNDYAAHLLLMLPAVAFLMMKAGRPIVLKVIGFGVFLLAAMQVLGTGSRGAVVGIAVTLLYIVFTASSKIRIAILVGVPVLGMIALPLVPKESRDRLMTLVSDSSQTGTTEAVESKQARLALLEESAKATLEHPLFGVGPGIFMDYQALSAKEQGQRGMWHVTHNAYTQISSECGLPALGFYLTALGLTFISLWKARRSSDAALSEVAYYISIMMVAFCACIFFLSLAYRVHLLTLSALTVALNQCLVRQRAAAENRTTGSVSNAMPERVRVSA